jgi:hypothetical protein
MEDHTLALVGSWFPHPSEGVCPEASQKALRASEAREVDVEAGSPF